MTAELLPADMHNQRTINQGRRTGRTRPPATMISWSLAVVQPAWSPHR
jgi:hypothetical protein